MWLSGASSSVPTLVEALGADVGITGSCLEWGGCQPRARRGLGPACRFSGGGHPALEQPPGLPELLTCCLSTHHPSRGREAGSLATVPPSHSSLQAHIRCASRFTLQPCWG